MYSALSFTKKTMQRFAVRVLLKVTAFRSLLKIRSFSRLIRGGTVTR
jgi:hypothetical protein